MDTDKQFAKDLERGKVGEKIALEYFKKKLNNPLLTVLNSYHPEGDVFNPHSERWISEVKSDYKSYFTPNITVEYMYKENTSEYFNKSELLNFAMRHSRSDFDWMSIVDVDMIYREDFLECVTDVFESDSYKVVVNRGVLMNIGQIDTFFNDSDRLFKDLLRIYSTCVSHGYSQVSLSKLVYDQIMEIYGLNTLYDFADLEFIGYGAEDVAVGRMLASLVENIDKISKIVMQGMWFHVWHKRQVINPILSKQHSLNLNRFELYCKRKMGIFKSGSRKI